MKIVAAIRFVFKMSRTRVFYLFSAAILLLVVVKLYKPEIPHNPQKLRVLGTDDRSIMNNSPRPLQTFVSQNPSNFLLSSRFDIIVKIIYANFYSQYGFVPQIVQDAYTEHIRVWNHFIEDKKKSKTDFINAFNKTIDSIKANGFVSEYGSIPVCENGFPRNGAHRIAASVVLSENVTVKQVKQNPHHMFNYLFFLRIGFKIELADIVMMQWMTIQQQLPIENKMVFILSLISNKSGFRDKIYQTVKAKCSLDNGILYEKTIKVNKLGMVQLVRHNYGNQNWIGAKIKQMVSKANTTLTIRFIFFFGGPLAGLNECKSQIRQLCSESDFNSAAHITDSANKSLILAEMILNPNSIEFLNYGKNGRDCQLIAEEIASRLGVSSVSTLPGIYIGREDFMIDSGSVLNLFDLRRRTDVDILFLNEIDESILGNYHGVNIQVHAFKENAISPGRAWGEDHFNQIVTTKWDLFYDPSNYGFCYGIKFVSLKQLIRYKMKRAEEKDKKDVILMDKLAKVIQKESLQQ